MRNARLGEAQAGIKIAGRNINNLRYADDTTLKVESEQELKSLLMKVGERRQDGTSIAKAKPTHRASSTTSWSYAYPSYKKHSTRNKSWIRNQLTRCLYTSLWTFLLGTNRPSEA